MGTSLSSFLWQDLLNWYEKNGRHHLIWRNYTIKTRERLYHIWLSEILLQQTQVDRVIPYFEKILQVYPTISDLSKATYEEFFPYYQGMGYYSRARNILKTAKIIHEEYSDIFPRELESLVKLPWVWCYTARALLAFGYNDAFLAWDTNLEKVFSRYYHGDKNIKLSVEEKYTVEEDFRNFIISNWERWDKWGIARSINNALMDFAAMLDLKNSENINWENYPIKWWLFYETRGANEQKEEKKSLSFPIPDATIIITLHKDHKIYYSSKIEEYTPFILPPALHRDTRKYIQEYFRKEYNLELSVRPVKMKWLDSNGNPYIAINAQIQTGIQSFQTFTKIQIL